MKVDRIKKLHRLKDYYNTTVLLSPQSFELFRTLQAVMPSKLIVELCSNIDRSEKPAIERCNRTVRFHITVLNTTYGDVGDLIERNIRDAASVRFSML